MTVEPWHDGDLTVGWSDMRLEPETIDVVSVAPADVPNTKLARWRCSRCDRSFEVCDSYAVTHRADDVESTAIVCPACAEEFRLTLP